MPDVDAKDLLVEIAVAGITTIIFPVAGLFVMSVFILGHLMPEMAYDHNGEDDPND
jgi:hypothetical protein